MVSRRELEQLFEATLALDPSERDEFLCKACHGDKELRLSVEALLSDDAKVGSFLNGSPVRLPYVGTIDPSPHNGAASPIQSTPPISDEEARPWLTPGQIVMDRFVVIRFIAKGGMGEVYEVEDRLLPSVHVALKTLLPRIARDPELQHRFEREVLLAQGVTHENLCPIYAIFHCDQPPPGFSFLTMKLLPGETLAARLREHVPVPMEEGLSILKQLVSGVAAIHAAGIVHRDIKPNNIILDGNGPKVRLWITDFGLARAYSGEVTISGHSIVAGTPGYIAPEIYRGQGPSQASDLFAFGVVLHEIFTGKKPVATADGLTVVPSPTLRSLSLPPLCIRMITGMLSTDLKTRCEAFDQALEAVDPKAKSSYRSLSPRFSWTRRRFFGAAVATASIAVGSTWWKWDQVENLLHPLPRKRFVALLNWPATSDVQFAPMLSGIIGAIKNELSRVEAFDRDLFVISPEDAGEHPSSSAHLKEVCDPLGANLVLGASSQKSQSSSNPQLILRLMDPDSGQPLREKKLTFNADEMTSLPGKAVHAAATLLNLRGYEHIYRRTVPGTQSAEAFTALQSAESLIKQPNDAGLEAAIGKYNEAVERDPRYATAYAKLALAYCRYHVIHQDPGILDLALGNCKLALTLDPNMVDAHLAHASVLEQTGDVNGALKEVARALALDPSDPRTLVWQAQLYGRLNRWADAERTFHRVLKERPNFWLAYNELGVVLNQQGKYQEAIQAFHAACVAAPGNALAFNNVGSIYLQTGKFSDAIDYLKKSLSLSPNALAYLNISIALRSEGKYSEALPYALKAIESDSSFDLAWLELADCYSSIPGHQSEAKAAYSRAAKEAEQRLHTDPADGAGWMLLALYRVKCGSPGDARSLIQKAESLGANDVDSQLYKARILELIGQREEALATLTACFKKGATPFAIAPVPDLHALRNDPRYQKLLTNNPQET